MDTSPVGPRIEGRGALLLALVGPLVLVLVWFQPQKLFIDRRVSEAAPAAAAAAHELGRGTFVSKEHRTTGVARIVQAGSGQQVLRLEGLNTSNGPDLRVYLSANPADGPDAAFDDDHVELGKLKGNRGDQNYDVPEGADLSRLRTVVIWCARFHVPFGAADLAA